MRRKLSAIVQLNVPIFSVFRERAAQYRTFQAKVEVFEVINENLLVANSVSMISKF